MKNIIMYSTNWCGDCVRSEDLLKSLDISFDVVYVEKEEGANDVIQEMQNGASRIRTRRFRDEALHVE